MKKLLASTLTAGAILALGAMPASADHQCAHTPSGEHETNGNPRLNNDSEGWHNSAKGAETAGENSETIGDCSP